MSRLALILVASLVASHAGAQGGEEQGKNLTCTYIFIAIAMLYGQLCHPNDERTHALEDVTATLRDLIRQKAPEMDDEAFDRIEAQIGGEIMHCSDRLPRQNFENLGDPDRLRAMTEELAELDLPLGGACL